MVSDWAWGSVLKIPYTVFLMMIGMIVAAIGIAAPVVSFDNLCYMAYYSAMRRHSTVYERSMDNKRGSLLHFPVYSRDIFNYDAKRYICSNLSCYSAWSPTGAANVVGNPLLGLHRMVM